MKVKEFANNAKEKMQTIAVNMVPLAMVGMTVMNQMAMAGDGGSLAEDLMKAAFTMFGILFAILAVYNLIVGAGHYARANSEGDGPAKSKAQGQLAAALMLGAIALASTMLSDKFVSMITAAITFD